MRDYISQTIATLCLFLMFCLGLWTGYETGGKSMFKEICTKNGGVVVEKFVCMNKGDVKMEMK